MTTQARRFRPRPRSIRSGAFLLALVGAVMVPAPSGGPLAAQEPDTIPPRRDTVPRLEPLPPDTVGRRLPEALMRQDTLGQDTVPTDSLGPPPPALPELPYVGPAGWSRGVWEWDRAALARLPDFSLLQLLERLPGIVPVRPDVMNQPESAAVFGAAGGAIRYVVDGFELDPMTAPTFDPSRFPLLALQSVRVERRVTGVTVRMRTLSPDDPRTRSIIEAGTGDGDVNLFRGMFLAPDVLGGPLGLGFERLGADGFAGGSSNHTAGWVKWTWVEGETGVQLEYRQSDMDRSGVGDALVGGRSDWAVRARSARGPVTGEVYAGATSVRDEVEDVVLREGSPHFGARLGAALEAPFPMEGRTALRFRDHPRLPALETELALRAAPLPYLAVEGEAVHGEWSEGPATGRWAARARVGPLLGLSAFGEYFEGSPPADRGPELRLPYVDRSPVRVTRDGVRAGAELRWRGLFLGGAALRTTVDTVPGFGLAMEPPGLGTPGGEATGFEVVARLPTGWAPLAVEGWYVGMDAPREWLYLPEHHWRAGLVYHHLPLPSGNLEIFARVEHVFRGRMTGPVGPGENGVPAEPALTTVGSYRATNLELTIRVLTLRAFLRWENILHRIRQQDLDGYFLPGQHVYYGVKWNFLN